MTQISKPLIRSLIEATEKIAQSNVTMDKIVIRAILFNLLTLMEVQTTRQDDIVTKVQALTCEYTCLYICDLLKGLADTANLKDDAPTMLRYAHSEVTRMTGMLTIPPAGRA